MTLGRYTLVLQQGGSNGGTGIDWPDTPGEALAQFSGVVADVLVFVAAFVAVYLLGRLVLVPLTNRAMRARGFDPTIRSLAENVVGVLALFAAVAVAFTVAGFEVFLAAFATIGGALALALGFAAQDLLSNFVAGIFILKDRPFEIGDWIEWNDMEGTVEDIDLRVTRVRTFDNERITVPNSELANNALTNPVAYDTLRQRFVFGIGYDDDITHATQVILEEAARVEGILDDPEPSVRVTELADSYVGLQARFWIGDPSRADLVGVQSEFVQAVKERCDAERIEMPYPYRELTGSIDVDGMTEQEPSAARADD
ncbi:mechanosensitive ion channel family protein [Halomarina pelagica]|uniref:mechanosensitive ion channel family protein n=1 Tax=Halomarina pelagica TaxID=2961599 RepID=UPI0020C511D1|nr:mechanosensitive ion channel family protein [Halomarina sp. BND7]